MRNSHELNSDEKPSESVLSKTKVFWDRKEAGKAYDKEFTDPIGYYVNESEMQPMADLMQDVKNSRVLDVGCGTGRHLSLLTEGNHLYGIDLSLSMLAEAQAKMPAGAFMSGSAVTLPFKDHSFDLVVSSRVLQHIRDQQKMISEMARVCKPGGQVIMLSYNSWSGLCAYKQIRLSWVGKILNIPFKLVLGKRSFFNPWGFDYDNYCSIPELSRFMKNSGLEVQRSWGATCGMPWFWNDFFIGKIVGRFLPGLLKAIVNIFLFLDKTIARIFPLKYFTDKVIVVAAKPR